MDLFLFTARWMFGRVGSCIMNCCTEKSLTETVSRRMCSRYVFSLNALCFVLAALVSRNNDGQLTCALLLLLILVFLQVQQLWDHPVVFDDGTRATKVSDEAKAFIKVYLLFLFLSQRWIM